MSAKRFRVSAFVVALAMAVSAFGGDGLSWPVRLTYPSIAADGSLSCGGSLRLDYGRSSSVAIAVRQDPPPAPDVFMLADLTYSSSGRFHQINRVERRYHDYGNGFFASVTTGTGWRLEDGVPVVAPLGIWWSGEVRVDFLVFVLGFGGDMVVPQNERVGFEVAAKLGFRIAID